MYPDEYLVVLVACSLAKNCRMFSVRNDFRDHRMWGKFEANYRPDFLYS